MIIRAPHNQQNPFFQLLRSTAQDTNLTARALGVLAYLLSKPDSWEPSVDDICRRFKDVGRDAAYKIITETFIPLRYAKRTQERDGGKFGRLSIEVFESPFPEKPEAVESEPEEQDLEGPLTEIPEAIEQEIAPFPDLPDTATPLPVPPLTVNQELYNTDKYIIQRRDTTERNKDMSGAIAPIVVGPVAEVFCYWQTRLNHQQAKLTPKRKRNIEARLKEKYTVEQIKTAIDGCASSPFHMGQNQNGTVYDDIELICRDGGKLEGFIAKVETRTGNGVLAQFSPAAQQTIAALDGFVKRHMAKEEI